MMFTKFFSRARNDTEAEALYRAVVAQSRCPDFYTVLGVSDSVDGRFDLLVLHVFLLLRRFRQEGTGMAEIAQNLFDTLFIDMDRSLREMGVGDLSVGGKVKQMAKAFYGRVAAYDSGLDGEAGVLEESLRRNLYRDTQPSPGQVSAVADYIRQESRSLAQCSCAGLAAGSVSFGALPLAESAPHD